MKNKLLLTLLLILSPSMGLAMNCEEVNLRFLIVKCVDDQVICYLARHDGGLHCIKNQGENNDK